ncbi:sensor histidine kinase [Leucobacter sp. NPDC058333]|uniref:sensor histidine kinase n=1 Tax=Leucobacter sp. NPDC058333 TaxID=3346450 RepID=UPI0036697057
MQADEHDQALRIARGGLHLLVVVLTGVSLVRALQAATGAGGNTDAETGNPHAAAWTVCVAAAALLAVYLGGRWASRAGRLGATLWLCALTIVWILALALSPEFVWLSFPILLIGGHLMRPVAGLGFGAVVIGAAVLVPAAHRGGVTLPEVLGPVIGGVFALGIARAYTSVLADAAEHRRLVASLVRAQQQAEELQGELVIAQRAAGALTERTRIARDIHDTIAQEFSSITLLARGALQRGETSETLVRVERMASRGAEDARRIVRDLLPAELEVSALAESLRRLTRSFADESGVSAHCEADAIGPLGTGAEIALLRTLQMALGNVRLHAHASRVGVELRVVGDAVRLDIVDDGEGFDAGEWEVHQGGGSSVGLREARARLQEMGGGLAVESTLGEGTALSAWVPLTHAGSPSADPIAGELSVGDLSVGDLSAGAQS